MTDILTPGTAVRLRLLDELPLIGCGYRLLLIETVGPKWVKLIDPTTLRHGKLPRADYERMKPTVADIAPSRLRRLLARTAATNKKFGLTQPKKAVKALRRKMG